jgi:hypothetical protein
MALVYNFFSKKDIPIFVVNPILISVKRLRLLLLLFSFITPGMLFCQPYFLWNDSIKVKTDVDFAPNPWAGGLNFVQVSNIDLNQDGVKDLFTFDRTGATIRTFIKTGPPGSTNYRYDPSYEAKFPKIYQWVLLADYNCDGKEDIFCYSTKGAGFDVYRNTSTPSTGLQFLKIVTQQLSVYYPEASPNTYCGPAIPCNLYVSPVDIPAISDIDNDGDLDVVTFDIFTGSFMIYHKNMSMEKYGTCDSLKFQVANHCWGYATENALNNTYTLHDTCKGNVLNPERIPNLADNTRHSGSCEICIDLDGDGDKEFIVGDIAFNNLTMLTNGGTPTSANFVKIDTAFPASNGSNVPIDLTIFPCPFYVDVNNDGLRDLVVSPNTANACENFNSMVYYKNTGTNSFPNFEYKQGNLLQDQMIDVGEGAYPVLFDYNNDGLLDLFIGNYGYFKKPNLLTSKIALFKNTGSKTTPQFELVTRDYSNLNSSGLSNMIPTFGDLDGDGDADMLIGDYNGNLFYYQNTAPSGAEPQFTLYKPYLRHSKGRVMDVGSFAAPMITDVDNDGINDVIIGSQNGKIAYYHNTGTLSANVPVFDSVTHFWGGINVTHPGTLQSYAYPFLFKDKGTTKLLVGSVDGYLHLFDNIDNNINGTFTLVDSMYQKVYQGTRTAPCGADLNNDGYLDLIVGNYQGGVSFYKGVSKDIIGVDTYDALLHFNFDLFPNPADNSVTIRIHYEYNKLYTVEIYNVMGQMMSEHLISNNLLNLDTGNMSPGMYLYKVYEVDANHVKRSAALTKRLIVQH